MTNVEEVEEVEEDEDDEEDETALTIGAKLYICMKIKTLYKNKRKW